MKILQVIDSVRETEAAGLLSDNYAIESDNDIETNEQAFNRIWLSTIPKGIFSFTEGQADTLLGIASLCPLSGGKPVYLARSLYALVSDSVAYDDSTACGGEEERLIKPKGTTSTSFSAAKIIPNPATREATLVYSITGPEPASFILINVLSKTKISADLKSGSHTFKFNCTSLVPGVYYYLIRTGNELLNSGKLLILKQ